jgi:hypothetical protein
MAKPKYPQSEALELARLNAIRMLGLHEHNTPEDRARAMGFEPGWGHGSPHNAITEMHSSRTGAQGPGAYATQHLPETAMYAGGKEGATSYPLMVKRAQALDIGMKNPYEHFGVEDDQALKRALHDADKTGMVVKQPSTADWLKDLDVADYPERNHYVSMHPHTFRSRFAAFDPARAHEAGLSYAKGGDVQLTPDQMRQELANRPQGLKAGAQPEPELLHPSTPEYQNLLAKYRDKAKMSAAENVQLGLNHPVSKVKLRAPVHELTYQEQEDLDQPMVPERRITPEDLYKAKGAGIGFLGDAARLAMLTHVGKEKLPRPVRLQAGVHFMRGVKPEGESSAWASAPSVISDLANKTREAAKIPGVENVLGLTASMTPTGVDFGRPLSKVLVGQLENQQPTKETAKLFNAAMRMKFPDFVGIDRPDLLHDQLTAPGAKSAAMRKAFVGLMDMKPFQAAGMPNVGHARVAISDPEQLHLPTNSIGLGISNLDPTGRVIKNPSKPHEDYPDELAQKHYMGRFEVPMSRSDVFSDFEAMRRAANKDPTDDPRSFDFSLPIQVFNQQWLDTIMPKYLAKRKAQLGFAEGGEVKADEPSHDEMLAHVMLHGMANLKDIGANEAPNLHVKTYVPQGPGPGFPVGGVDFQPETKGQQMLPGQPNAPMRATPPQLGQPAGQMPPSGQPPAPAPGGPQSNILQMTPQGQAMAAMKATPPMAKMAGGGSIKDYIRITERPL